MHAGLGGLHWVELVMNGRCRTGQVVDLVHLDVEREGHIVAHELKVRMIEQMDNVVLGAGEEIIEADDVMAIVQQAFAEMGSEKAGAASDQNCFSHNSYILI